MDCALRHISRSVALALKCSGLLPSCTIALNALSLHGCVRRNRPSFTSRTSLPSPPLLVAVVVWFTHSDVAMSANGTIRSPARVDACATCDPGPPDAVWGAPSCQSRAPFFPPLAAPRLRA